MSNYRSILYRLLQNVAMPSHQNPTPAISLVNELMRREKPLAWALQEIEIEHPPWRPRSSKLKKLTYVPDIIRSTVQTRDASRSSSSVN